MKSASQQTERVDRRFRLLGAWIPTGVLILFLGAANSPLPAAVFNVAQTFDLVDNENDGDPFDYGYLFSGNQPGQNEAFILNNTHQGFLAYPDVGPGNPGSDGWLLSSGPFGLGFPFTGVLSVPPDQLFDPAGEPAVDGGPAFDWPSAAGDNPDYPFGVIGGHGATAAAATGWYTVRFTAPAEHAGPVDLVAKVWAAAVYPEVSHGGANNPPFGGNNRPHQITVQRDDQTLLYRGPMVTRHGWTNTSGTPHHTAEFANTPGDPATFPTHGDEREAALASSLRPNEVRLTGVNLAAGESLDVSLAGYFGENNTGFHVFDVQVLTGEDRTPTETWDLARDFSVHGTTAQDIGPEGAWSFGIQSGGSFAAYDKTLFGITPDDGVNPRENHGWASSSPGWFVAAAPEPETGPVTPGMMKDYDGNNMTRAQSGDGMLDAHLGDWPGGKVTLHTPSADVDADQTSVVRWTAPEDMTVDVDGAFWPTFLPANQGGGDRLHEFELIQNGTTSIASGMIDPLDFDCGLGSNSTCGSPLMANGISVSAGDTLDLLIRPQSGSESTFISLDLALQRAMAMVLPGDTNGDGNINFNDLSPFVSPLTDVPGYQAMFPGLYPTSCDINGDTNCNFNDLSPFVALLTGGNAAGQSVPEPASGLLWLTLLVTYASCRAGRTSS